MTQPEDDVQYFQGLELKSLDADLRQRLMHVAIQQMGNKPARTRMDVMMPWLPKLLTLAAALYLVFAIWPSSKKTKAPESQRPDYSVEIKRMELGRWQFTGLAGGKALLKQKDAEGEIHEILLSQQDRLNDFSVSKLTEYCVVLQGPNQSMLVLHKRGAVGQ